MGYELYITRADTWLERRQHPISGPEWDAVVATDAELKWSTQDWYERQSANRRVERFYAVIWITHPEKVPFWFMDGAIQTKNPDQMTIRKMVDLAHKLSAKVLGEEGEEYGPDGEVVSLG